MVYKFIERSRGVVIFSVSLIAFGTVGLFLQFLSLSLIPWENLLPDVRAAIPRSRSTRARFAIRASGVKRGSAPRKSPLANSVFSSIRPVRKPRPSGL